MSVEKFNHLVKNNISPLLKESGFRKNSLTWNKEVFEFLQILSIQKHKTSNSVSVDFTFNLGIFSKSVYEIVWDKESPKNPQEVDCLLRYRIGPVIQNCLSGEALDKWWVIDNSTDVTQLSDELVSVLKNSALPFLNRFKSFGDIHIFLEKDWCWQNMTPLHPLYLAVLNYKLGNPSKAKERIVDLINKHEAWKERCITTAINMGFDL